MESSKSEAALSMNSKTTNEAGLEKESKAEVNGCSSTGKDATETPKDSEKPAPESEKSSEKQSDSNGVVDSDVKMKNGGDTAEESADGPTKESAERSEAKASASPKAGEEDKTKTESNSAPSKCNEPAVVDVEMADAKAADETPTSQNSEKKESTPNETSSADSTKVATPKKEISDNAAATKDSEKSTKPIESASRSPAQAESTTKSDAEVQPASLSQLAIDTKEVEPSVEVAMTDAPVSKIAREREDDSIEGPAPKRAKTEPEEDVPERPSQPTTSTGEAAVIDETKPRFDEFPKWNDAEHSATVLTPYRQREMRRTVDRVKKTKSGIQFRDSVERLWAALWPAYIAKIDTPMDLGQISRALRDEKYRTYADFKVDLALILQNSHTFNGPVHEVTKGARSACKAIWDDVVFLPAEEPTKAKPSPKVKAPRESRNASFHSAGHSNAPGPSPTTATAPVPTPSRPADDARRGSSANDADRPKRTVRAPKSKDIDYSSKPSRKKLKPELQFCEEVLAELMSPKHFQLNQWFLDAVDAQGLGVPHYYKLIKHPMDLGKVSRMLANGDIDTIKDFQKNIKLIFDNCYTFNGRPETDSPVSLVAQKLQDMYHSLMKNKDSWLAKHAKAHPPPASASNASDDEEEEDDEEESEEVPLGPDPAREVKDLEERLHEETAKQTSLFAAELPNQSMILIQKGIVDMVQDALLKAKKALNEYRQKHGAGKPNKKSKPSKTKASGGGSAARKGSSAAAPPKKTGGAPSKKKKNLTAADKDNIANAINDLEGQHLDRAIDIIKRDTGQMESDDGELELDIDQLSSEALLKLWELCKRILPGFGKNPAHEAATSSPEAHRRASTSKTPATSAKPKKNKPMSAQEQEARIAQLRGIRDLYKSGQESAEDSHIAQATTPAHDSSDDSSEEE